jgi:hypothetical protein
MAVMAFGNGAALAQVTCPDVAIPPAQQPLVGFPGYMDSAQAAACNATYGGCFRFDGSDTLTEVMQLAIDQSGACMAYINVGSGQGEKNIADLSGFTVHQGIAPMSRNFAPAVLPGYAVTDQNVLSLDAAVLAVANIGGRCLNVNAPLEDVSDPGKAQITTDLSIVFSGYPAGGPGTKSKATTAECAHPERLAALARLTSCQGVARIDHIYRRDDKSGTQDTIREHLQFDRWCNGKSEGDNNKPGANLKNEDLDPIRRPCIGADATKAATTCTYFPLTTKCTAGAAPINDPTYGEIKCTQGLIVALSENDPGAKDITISIGNRIAQDLNGYTIGMAGLALVELDGAPTVGTNINTVTYEPGNIRAGQYMFSRRLFLHYDPNPTPANGAESVTGRRTEEDKLYNFITNRCNAESINRTAGFLPPLAVCSDPCNDPLNITCLTAEAGVNTPKQNIGAEVTTCGASNGYPCVADGVVRTSGTCPVLPVLGSAYACNQGEKCSSTTCNLDSTLLGGSCQ